MGAIRFLSTCFIWFPCGLPIAHMGHRSCTQFPHILPTVPPIWAPYSFCPPALYGSHVGCPLPIWVTDPAHSFHISCPQFHPYGPHTVFVHLLHMGPKWVANMQYGSHVWCQYGSQILPTFPPDHAYFSAFKGTVRFLSARFIRVPRGVPNRVPVPGEMEHCTSSRIKY